jgi:alpha-glucosidase
MRVGLQIHSQNQATTRMNRITLCFLCLIVGPFTVFGIDLQGLQPIGGVASVSQRESGLLLECKDGSQVAVYILAPDLVRIRASFSKPLAALDHSWAIERTEWEAVKWQLEESKETVSVKTQQLTLFIRKDPLLIEFRDARTGKVINADERPMMHDSTGSRKVTQFDPNAGEYIAVSKKLGFDEHFYGLGEKAARLDKRRESFTNWNSDTPGYVEGRDPIYQTVPFYIGLQNGDAYGIFFDNSYRSYFDFGKSSQAYAAFAAEGGEANYYFIWGPSIKKILGRYADLTGHMPLPPMWALGNQQSRWSYYPESMAEQVVNEYRKRDLPLDVLHLDIDYMQAYRVFTFDTSRFPNPKAMTDRFRKQGVKVITIVDPGVKYQPAANGADSSTSTRPNPELQPQDKSYYVFNQGLARGFFQKRKNGELFIPKVWPGDSVFVDFTLPEARRWWGDLHSAYVDNGIAGIWNDMNEPSDFVDQTGKNQLDVVSYDEGQHTTHAKNRNLFALQEARATYEGLVRLRPDNRPYIITRAGYAGIQRYSTMWTGDTTSTWETLALSIPVFQTLGLSGEPFVGSDIGGFIGRGNGELLARSYQVGFLAPFCRNHKTIDGYDQEPWRFGKYYEDIIRKYLKLRYRLMPFLYTTLENAHRTGVPLFRPLVLNYQSDENTFNLDDQFIVGDDLLVAPIAKPDVTSRLVYLPEGKWYDYWTNKPLAGGSTIRADAPLDTVPMYVRGGSIIPLGPDMKFVGEKPLDPINFNIYPDERGAASAVLYEDDGESPGYSSGVFRRTAVAYGTAAGRATIRVAAPQGSYRVAARQFIFSVRTDQRPSRVTVDGRALSQGAEGQGWNYKDGWLVVPVQDNGLERIVTIE